MKLFYLCSLGFAALGIPIAMDAQAVDSAQEAFDKLADKFGLWAAVALLLMVVIIVTTWLRERRMAKRIDVLEEKFIAAVAAQKEMQAAISLQTRALEELIGQVRGQTDVLKEIKTVFSIKTCPFPKGG